MLEKSIFSIIGYIISQISIAIGIETCAYSNLLSNLGIKGRYCPINIPAMIQSSTQTLKYLSKKLSLFSSAIAYS
jgi:hypothetical protein